MTDLPRCGTPEDFIEDRQFQDGIIERVEGGAITIKGATLGCPEVEGVDPPAVGDRVRLWPGLLVGMRVRGLALRGSVLYYRTEAEVQADDEADIARRNAEDKESYEESGKAEQQKRFGALPAAFQRRVKMRQQNNPDFGWRFESYELFCCEQAAIFAERAREAVTDGVPEEVDLYFKRLLEKAIAEAETERSMALEQGQDDPGEVDAAKREVIARDVVPPNPAVRWLFWWRDLSSPSVRDFDRQKAEMPGIADDHSGNTFSAAFRLAVIWLTHGEKGVVAQHGALAPLVGSQEYGDLTEEQIKALEAE